VFRASVFKAKKYDLTFTDTFYAFLCAINQHKHHGDCQKDIDKMRPSFGSCAYPPKKEISFYDPVSSSS